MNLSRETSLNKCQSNDKNTSKHDISQEDQRLSRCNESLDSQNSNNIRGGEDVVGFERRQNEEELLSNEIYKTPKRLNDNISIGESTIATDTCTSFSTHLKHEEKMENKYKSNENSLENENQKYQGRIDKNINTSSLAPSEIRNGRDKTINKDNIALFQYSIPPFDEMKQRLNTETKSSDNNHINESENLDENFNKTNIDKENLNESSQSNENFSETVQASNGDLNKPAEIQYNPYP